jgi:hypothetical protein
MRSMSEDWLTNTIRNVEAVMERHGFVEDVAPEAELSAKQSPNTLDWNKLLRRFGILRLS